MNPLAEVDSRHGAQCAPSLSPTRYRRATESCCEICLILQTHTLVSRLLKGLQMLPAPQALLGYRKPGACLKACIAAPGAPHDLQRKKAVMDSQQSIYVSWTQGWQRHARPADARRTLWPQLQLVQSVPPRKPSAA